MGCVSSTLLANDDEFSQIGSSALGHHIVSLTSTTYGLLSLDPPPSSSQSHPTNLPPNHPPRFTHSAIFPNQNDPPARSDPPEIINSWELMAGLSDDTSSRFSPLPPPQPSKRFPIRDIENSNPNICRSTSSILKQNLKGVLDKKGFQNLCPPNGDNRVVIYTTTLRGVRKTFEDCNAVRAAFQGFGVKICERDISMDRGFKEELRELMKGKDDLVVVPRVFVKGRYVGGAEEVMKKVEEGCFGDLVEGLPKLEYKAGGYVCEGCGGIRFLPCFRCNGSCKVVKEVEEVRILGPKERHSNVAVVRCSDCNENGLVLCPICS